MEREYLGSPIYLDTNTLLDLLASMEDGFSTAKKIVSRDSDMRADEILGEGKFGISFLNMFKIGFGGSKSIDHSRESGEEHEEERVHTYGSLMNRLIKNLNEAKVIKTVQDEESWENINESDFVILQGEFIPNPIVKSFKNVDSMFDMLIRMGLGDQLPTSDQAPLQNSGDSEAPNISVLKEMINNVISDLERENYQKYVIELKRSPNMKVISYLFNEYIRDRAGVELPYGEFNLLGKVVRKIEGDESFDLLQGSVIGFSEEIINGFIKPFEDLKKQGFEIPEIFTEVNSPAIQVIPIAVFA
ncbi:hypothetical protein DSECCO2_544560 [anaerobic digester metagenome]